MMLRLLLVTALLLTLAFAGDFKPDDPNEDDKGAFFKFLTTLGGKNAGQPFELDEKEPAKLEGQGFAQETEAAIAEVDKLAESAPKAKKATKSSGAISPTLLELQTRLSVHAIDTTIAMGSYAVGSEARRQILATWCEDNESTCAKLDAADLNYLETPLTGAESDFKKLKVRGIQANLLALHCIHQDRAIVRELATAVVTPNTGASNTAWADHILGQGALRRWIAMLGGEAAIPARATHPIRRWMAAADTTAFKFQGLANYYPQAGGDNQGVVFSYISTYLQQAAAQAGGLTAPQKAEICSYGVRAATKGSIDLVAHWRLRAHPAQFAMFHSAWNRSNRRAVPANQVVAEAKQKAVEYGQIYAHLGRVVQNANFVAHFCMS